MHNALVRFLATAQTMRRSERYFLCIDRQSNVFTYSCRMTNESFEISDVFTRSYYMTCADCVFWELKILVHGVTHMHRLLINLMV